MFKKGNNLNTSTQQRASLGRFAALVTDSIKDTDQDDFIPTTQKRYSEVITTTTTTTKRKLANSSTNANTFEKKRTKKSSLFSDVVSVSSINLQANNTSSPPPPWLDLPTEIIQHIFSYIPIKPLITQIAGVCRKWYNVIRDEKFLRWAKIHLRYEYEELGTLRMIDQMIDPSDNILQSILQRASAIINDNIMNEKTIQFKFSMSILIQLNKRLQKHSVYQYAIDLLSKNKLQQQFQLLNSHEKIFNPLCTTTAICILSDDIQCIRKLFHLWMTMDQLKYETIMDFFYFLLTLFTGATRLCNLQFRYPYRLYYCLKEFEDQTLIKYNPIAQYILNNDSSYTTYSTILTKLLLTPEQEVIVCHNLENRETMKINAYAGTGKTTTLIAYAAKRMDESFLYIAYNKAIQTYAEKVFPPNVKCQTIHSLAYAKIGRQYDGCLGNLRLKSIVDIVNDRPLIGEKGRSINSLYIRARFVYNTLNNFIASADFEITDEHVDNSSSNQLSNELALTLQEKQNLAADARHVWSIMKNIRDKRVLMTHDGYLKLYQLSKPQIQLYDCLFVDEAQDLTPAVTDIVNSQRVSKILVGDKHQQIYAFRGAVDAMMKIQSTVTYYLTKSFRFGYDIAFMSNLILQKLCNEKKYLVGNNKSSCLDGRSASIENIVNEQKAYLFRTNYSLFNCAVQLIIEKGLKNVGFVGGKEAMGFDRILDIFYLWLDPEERRKKNYQIRDPQIQSFQSFKTFEKFSLEVADTELIGKIKLVQSHGHSLIDKIKQLQEKSCSDINQASTKKKQTRFILSIKEFYLEIVLSTAHKAKGLEFPIVILADDFLPRSSDVTLDKISLDVQRENLNILYVATTRATKELILNMDLFYLLYKMCREPAYDLSFSSQTEQCASCAIESDSPEIKNEILFKIKQIQLSSNTITAGEYSPLPNCVKHLSQSFVSITQLYQNV
ncbi:unnamed protein product [Adineta steineri]|uniref:F-box domain-containing protein n=1 Tax=Adineta steineri TaxID=433720 RepID=A0A818J2H8_9BILA|nr:unnamed protein product [Adineta steineri]CAF3529189.1 unnamed protein product [Adineta steineri]